jgi:hypothetical protein
MGMIMTESMRFNRDLSYTSEWWKANERRAAAARIENKRTAARFEQMKAEQEERVNREERERWAAAHGAEQKV